MAPKKNIFEKSIILNKLDWELFLKKFIPKTLRDFSVRSRVVNDLPN